jgi:Iap family predicted aminopeptidase
MQKSAFPVIIMLNNDCYMTSVEIWYDSILYNWAGVQMLQQESLSSNKALKIMNYERKKDQTSDQ